MRQGYDAALGARLTIDAGRVTGIDHHDRHWPATATSPRLAAIEYLGEVADVLDLPRRELQRLHQPVTYTEPQERGTEYRLSEDKSFFDSTTTGFAQTHLNVPVWRTGVTVTVKHAPLRVVAASSTRVDDVDAAMPDREIVERYQKLFREADVERARLDAGEQLPEDRPTAALIRALLGDDQGEGRGARLIRGRFFVYRYDPRERLPQDVRDDLDDPNSSNGPGGTRRATRPLEEVPWLPLPPVDDRIRPGRDSLVAELTFAYPTTRWGPLNWRALVELETGSVLYLRALAASSNGFVYTYDPITETGNPANTPDQSNAVLNPFRDDVALPNLDAPVAGVQALSGSLAAVSDETLPTVMAPTEASGTDFDYDVRTNEFAAVNSYFHVDRFFALVEDLGFPLASYFDQTTFPVPVDHRGLGEVINAHCVGDGLGGIDHLCYALNDSDTTDPVGIAADWRVHLHELGGHGILYEHVDSAYLGFSHSAGDSMAVILNDPESLAADRFLFLPWVPAVVRRFDRDVTAGWAWGGSEDGGGYDSEEILATTLFRIYRSIGGDSSSVDRRWFAARASTYLILRAVSLLTPATNPSDASGFADALMAADLLNWDSEGVFGGAYSKVIRWSFEQQGLYQPVGAPTPVVSAGAPPAVDVYIDDGRAGEYAYQAVHWNTTAIWNRLAPDGGTTHEEPVLGATNHAYVKIKNRGTQTAEDVIVRGYHCLPSAGLLWPDDLQPMDTPEIAVGDVGPDDTDEQTIGPFAWVPITNAYGHDCMLMIVSATGDASNVDEFTAGEVIAEWRLVPNDNNVGQRNVQPVPGGGSLEGLLAGLDGISFWVGNPDPGRAAVMSLDAHLPAVLADRGWTLSFEGGSRFPLEHRDRREVTIRLHPGAPFSAADVEQAADRDITVTVTGAGGVIGGMTYRLDPVIVRPRNPRGPRPSDCDHDACRDRAEALLECLDLGGRPVESVKVKRVTVDIDLRDGCCE